MSLQAVTPEQPSGVRSHRQPAHGRRRQRRLLIADDEPQIREHLTQTLTAAGYHVIGQASSRTEATAMTTSMRPDLVILDTRLLTDGTHPAPVRPGSETTTPVMLLGNLARPSDLQHAQAAGAMGVVAKPFTTASLIPAIEMAVARHIDTTELRAQVIDIGNRLESRKVIERAKGLVMTSRRMTEPDAYRFLRRAAMDQRLPMETVAAAIIGAHQPDRPGRPRFKAPPSE